MTTANVQPKPSQGVTPTPTTLARPPCVFAPFVLVDVSSGREVQAGSSYANEQEAEIVTSLLCSDRWRGGDPLSSVPAHGRLKVGVVTPYRSQVHLLQQRLKGREAFDKDGNNGFDVEVSPV